MNIHVHVLGYTYFLFFFFLFGGINLGNVWLGHMGTQCLTFEGTFKVFSNMVYSFVFP